MPMVEDLNIYLSPRPWAHITVAVCFFKAGTTRAAEPAIPSERYGIRGGSCRQNLRGSLAN